MEPRDDTAPTPSQAALAEIVEEYEGKTRRLAGHWGLLVAALLVLMSLYHLYAGQATFVRQVHLVRFLIFTLVLTFLLYPGTRRSLQRQTPTWWDVALALASIVSLGYVLWDFERFIYRSYIPTTPDLVLGTATILLVLEATRRAVGNALLLVVCGFLAYAFVGQVLPEPWAHRGYDLQRVVGQLYITLEGIFGVPLEVAATFIILFTIYGAILDASGAGKFFVDLALALTGHRRTGPGQAVTVASFLLGGPSGSGVATTVTVGAITYPMLRRAGYDRESAGGLLSAGGIGAVISPPILGAAAFIIAEILRISYLQVLIMVSIPTVLYYFSILLMIEFDARRMALRRVEIAAGNARELALRYWYLLSSLVLIPIFMIVGFTAIKAVFWASVVAVATSLLRRETALVTARRAAADERGLLAADGGLRVDGVVVRPAGLLKALEDGSRQVLNVGVTCAAAGIVVGVVNLTGLGLKLSDVIIAYAGGQLLPTLVFAAIALWVLGLALPITATYIIAAVIVAPALTKLGVSELAAHLFIFYYAILSEVSPPVGLAPLAAAALTGGRPFRTMMMAWKYTLPAFVVPFMFTTHPSGLGLLLQAPWPTVAQVTAIALLGLVAAASAVTGWLVRQCTVVERAILAVAALFLLYPAGLQDVPAIAAIVAVAIFQWYTRTGMVSPHAGEPGGTGVAGR
ncbi:MAG: TRAP transporter fused permease subunit [Armatimonadota bacterium]|nr:TRAP transporter fused permease subunit [Armatimonadota bacterium]MDR7421608.1 TRAP transporter fused permease subunit [Armatimonadota bacterium]MDR7454578.1 TRAP transporter fused permease subunit [Armatimonadota bacterium]MDR7456018.1 TRAP transporter fused permease subunit [Armatimonadota bacterium]MDR7495945.1 TRAP transporter fused permease subunit [Armatimonadota bacterium]